MVRVAVGERDLLVLEGITHAVAGMSDVEVVAVCPTILQLERAIAAEQVDVVITAIRIPPGESDDGIEFAARLRASHPEIGVIILSQFVESEYALRLFERGSAARAYLLKHRITHDELADAITTVAAGGSRVDSKVVEALIADRRRATESPLRVLTPRERQVLSLVAEGRSNASIASTMSLTKRAVEKHMNSVFSKLDLPDESIASRRVHAMLLFLAEHPPTPAPLPPRGGEGRSV